MNICGQRLTATSFDDEKSVVKKYANAERCIQYITSHGAKVFHGVDATRLDQTLPRIDGLPHCFDYIIFNFPHTGQQRVHLNRNLVRDFFHSARPVLTPMGEIHMALKDRPPYSNWNIEEYARHHHYLLKARQKFDPQHYPGYRHRTTDPLAKNFETELCIKYVFIVNRQKFPTKTVPTAPPSAIYAKNLITESESDLSLSPGASTTHTLVPLWKPWHRSLFQIST